MLPRVLSNFLDAVHYQRFSVIIYVSMRSVTNDTILQLNESSAILKSLWLKTKLSVRIAKMKNALDKEDIPSFAKLPFSIQYCIIPPLLYFSGFRFQILFLVLLPE